MGHLLIVDDEVQLTRIICEALTKYGYETVGVASPQEAVELLRRQDFDLLLTDLSMPKMDGIELLRAAAEIDPSIVGILMTGHGTVQTAVDAMKTGAHDYILKPFKLQDALNVVARAMESRRLMLENVQLREMLAIHELTIALARAHDLDVIVEKAVSAVVNQLDADEASILLPTSDQRELYVAAVRGADRSQILGERTPKTRGIAGWVALQRQAVLLEGEVDDERFAPVAPRAEIMSSMSAPMIEGGRLVGVINVNTLCAERSFDAEDVDLLSTFASESARSLAQFPDGVTGADLDSALQAIADDVIERLGTDEASVMLPTSDGKELYVAALGGNRPVRVLGARVSISAGIAGWVADHKTPVTLNGTVDDSRFAPMYPRPDIVSSISMPMMAGGRVVGIVNANVVNRRRPFAPGAVKALNVLAGAAASAIAEATLQQQLREAEERYRTIVENAVEGIFQSCPDGRFLTVNPSHARILGYDSPEDFLTNVTSSEQLHVDAGRRDQFWALLSEQGVARDFEARFRRKDGKVVWISVNARAIRDSDGGIVACEGTMQDITARMEAQEAQIESGKFLQATLDALPAHIAVLDENGIIITTNAAWRNFDHPPPVLCGGWNPGTNYIDVCDQAEGADKEIGHEAANALRALICGESPGFDIEYPCYSPQKSRWFRMRATRFPGDGPCRIAMILADFTVAKQAELEIGRLNERQTLILDSIEEGIHGIDLAGNVTFENSAAHRMLGWEEKEMIGKFAHPMAHHTKADGSPYPVEECPILLTLQTGVVHHVKNEVFWRKDGTSFPAEYTSAPLRDESQRVVGGVVSFRDITERLKYEEMQAAREVADAANKAKSEFLSRMSHELRTPLNAIIGFGQILEMRPLGDLERESVGYILKGGRHLLDLINEILDIARVESGRLNLSIEPVEISQLLADTVELVRSLASPHGVQISVRQNEASTKRVLGDHQRLKQVLINLTGNAIKYNRKGGNVCLSCESLPNEHIRISVADTGYGLSTQDIAKIFVPFERLRARETDVEGTGLGLTLSRRLMEEMNGTLGVESVVGQGSTFYVDLPLAPPQPADSAIEALLKPVLQNAENPPVAQPTMTVLSIEDNASNYRLIEAILRERPGVKLIGAMRGNEGISVAQTQHPDLILLDMHLPDMTGLDVLKALRQDPHTASIPVVVVSADATKSHIKRVLESGVRDYLTKPLNVKQVLQTIDNVFLENRE